MNCLDAAQQFNKVCPKGTPVEIALRSGGTLRAKTTCAAYVWGNLALVEVDAHQGFYQVQYVRVLKRDPERPGD